MKKICVLFLVLLCLSALTSCRNNLVSPQDTSPEMTTASTDDTTSGQTIPSADCLRTPYCDLRIPAEYDGAVTASVVSENPYTVEFAVKDGPGLFSLVFGAKTDALLGTLKLADQNVVIYAMFAAFDPADAQYDRYCMYQEGINSIIAQLVSDYDFAVNQVVEYEETGVFEIPAAVSLWYPNKWKNQVHIDVSDEAVRFSCKGEKLFDICFAACGGYLLGMYNGTPVYVVSYEFDETKYTEKECIMLYSMQEDVNVILQHLMEDARFVVSK